MRAPRQRRDAGALTLEFVITMPMLLLTLMAAVQLGLVAHAQSAAQAAADEGASLARAYDGSASQGKARAHEYVTRLAGSMFSNYQVSADRGAQTASVTITAQVTSLVPGWSPTIQRTSTGPVERFAEDRS